MSEFQDGAALIKGGSRTFHAASLMFPRRYRDPALALYAFCRLADDAVDCAANPGAALDDLRGRLDRIYRGSTLIAPVDRMFAGVVERFAIPRALPEALLEGFQWDAEGRHYETFDNVVAYAVRVAGTVGCMMTLLMGRREPAVLARAIELGVAMQLTNIARDVGEDARNGRLYLPRQWLVAAGIEPDKFVGDPTFTPALGHVVERLLDEAEMIYRNAELGISHLPWSSRVAIAAARILYGEIGVEVARNSFDSVSRRAVVSSARKLSLAPRVFRLASARRSSVDAPSLYQARVLVDAAAIRGGVAAPDTPPGWRIGGRIVWVIDLFEQLERREQLRRAGG
jgi:15-cis-phytoene synthase